MAVHMALTWHPPMFQQPLSVLVGATEKLKSRKYLQRATPVPIVLY